MKIEPVWKDQTCVILAGGPSLTHSGYQEAFNLQLPVIAINESWRLIPWQTYTHAKPVLYFCDAKWWFKSLSQNLRVLPTAFANLRVITDENFLSSTEGIIAFHDVVYKGQWITGSSDQHFSDHPQVKTVILSKQQGLEKDPRGLAHGSNSGYQAINLAFHFGVKKIILIGYDMQLDKSGMSHWHTDGDRPAHAMQHVMKTSFLPNFPSLAEALTEEGIRVYNASPDSALTVFPRFKNFREAYEASNPMSHFFDEGIEHQPLGSVCALCGESEKDHIQL
jgi:hypothetical protein